MLGKINLLFTSNENYIKWENQDYNWNQVIIDLNINEIISYLEEINIDFQSQYFSMPCLDSADAIYRLNIMEELLYNNELLRTLTTYSDKIKVLNFNRIKFCDEKNEVQKQYRYLQVVCEYFSCVFDIFVKLKDVKSQGLLSLHKYCENIYTDDKFIYLYKDAKELRFDIENMLSNNILAIEPLEKIFSIEKGRIDLNESKNIKEMIFDIFGIDVNNEFSVIDPAPFSNMEEKILKVLQQSYESIFERLKIFYKKSIKLLEDINSFADLYKQLTFYISYINFLKLVTQGEICICKPIFDDEKFSARECASPSLIIKSLKNNTLDTIVTNNINLSKGKMFVLSGPNQGGKTFYLKTFGQTAYLAKCGCFVLSNCCLVPFYDRIFTHFNQIEVLGKGRLIEEVERIEKMITKITENSLILLNESFISTRRKDGVQISIYYLEKFAKIGCMVGFVSHYYEIPELINNDELIISLTCGIESDGSRTYKVSKRVADGLAYAHDIAYKCNMTFEQILSAIEVDVNEKN